MIIYLAFCLIVATLVVQGLTLPWLIRRLGLSEPVRMKDEEQEARRVLLREALVHLDRKRSKNRDQSAMFGELIAGYQQRLDAIPAEREERVQGLVDQARRSATILEVLQAERVALIRLWDEGQIDDEVLRTLTARTRPRGEPCAHGLSCSALESVLAFLFETGAETNAQVRSFAFAGVRRPV